MFEVLEYWVLDIVDSYYVVFEILESEVFDLVLFDIELRGFLIGIDFGMKFFGFGILYIFLMGI